MALNWTNRVNLDAFRDRDAERPSRDYLIDDEGTGGFVSPLGHDHQGHRRVAGQADGDGTDGTVGGVGRASDDDRHGLIVM